MQNRYIWYVGSAVVFLALAIGITSYIYFSKEEVIVEDIVVEAPIKYPIESVIGKSVEGKDIVAYTYGDGDTRVIFVGGIHGGYEWNSVYLMHRYLDYLNESMKSVPPGIELVVIPVLNPDGLYEVVGTASRFDPATTPAVKETEPGRFNANDVDLNRNFDCNWQATSTWRTEIVDAGTDVFSEPEAKALRDFILKKDTSAVVFWHSASNAVYASACNGDVSSTTRDIMNAYANASGYPTFDSFEHYEITGDAGDWLAKIGIASIAVEMADHDTIDWSRELAGINAVLEYFSVDR